jgi:hypothetical protein
MTAYTDLEIAYAEIELMALKQLLAGYRGLAMLVRRGYTGGDNNLPLHRLVGALLSCNGDPNEAFPDVLSNRISWLAARLDLEDWLARKAAYEAAGEGVTQ